MKKKFLLCLTISICYFFSGINAVYSQLTITSGSTATQLVNSLIGSGITVFNAKFTGATDSRGIFSNGNTTNLGLNRGIVISTGRVQNAAGNSASTATYYYGMPGDSLLSIAAKQYTNDAAFLEFDFIPVSDTIKFRYIFGSDEYPNYVGQNYNDVFGFFITGPNPLGGIMKDSNVAIIPATSQYVTINNVNNGPNNTGPCMNCSYYVANSGVYVQYNGFTKPLTAVCRVVPCQTYHIKIAIADAFDGWYDSGVFLEENSFSSNTITTKTNFSIPSINNGAVEGCNNASVTFSLPSPKSLPYAIHYTIAGTATNGLDYSTIPDSVVIPAGQYFVNLNINPLNDTLVEPTETVVLKYKNVLCSTVTWDSVVVYIFDKQPFNVTPGPNHSICYGFPDSIYVTPTGGFGPYMYFWADTLVNKPVRKIYIKNTTSYIVTTKDRCNSIFVDTLKVTVNPKPVVSFLTDSVSCLKNNNFLFSNSSSIPAPRTLNHIWTFGDGDNSTAASPTHSYLSPGNYVVKLVSTSSDGCSDSAVKNTIVYDSPNLKFGINDTTQCLITNRFNFTNNSSIGTGSVSYRWSFGDGSFSVQQNPAHIYASGDTFDVKLIGTSDKGCIDSMIHKTYVYPSPRASFTTDTAMCLKGNNFVCNNTTRIIPARPMSYLWKFGNGDTSNSVSPVYSYASAGNFTIKMLATSIDGCKDSFTRNVFVRPSPVVTFNVNDSTQCGSSNNFIFTNTSKISAGSLTYHWYFGDGDSSNTASPTHSYAASNRYKVTLRATSDRGCSDSLILNVSTFPSPVADFKTDDSIQCFRNNLFNFTNLSSISSGTLSYDWDLGDGNVSTTTHVTHQYSTFDTFIVGLKVTSDEGCVKNVTRSVFVYPMPAADFMVNDSNQCLKGNNYIFTNMSSLAQGTMSYFWNFGDTTTSNALNPTHSYSYESKFPVLLVVTSDKNCIDSARHTMTTFAMLNASFNHSKSCLDDSTRFTDHSTVVAPGVISNWLWDFGDGFASTFQHPVHVYKNAGTFKIQLIVTSDKNCTDSASLTVTVAPHVPANTLTLATVDTDKTVYIEWQPVSLGIPKSYVLEKSEDGHNFSILGTFDLSKRSYLDKNVFSDTKSYIYRTKVIDSCNYNSPYSNIGKTILLEARHGSDNPHLNWTEYRDWSSGVVQYLVQIFDDSKKKFVEIGITSGDSNFTDNSQKLNQPMYCYRVTAISGDGTRSESNVACIPTKMDLWIPNAFSPNSDSINRYFRIVANYFTSFQIVIYNRWGLKLFESNDINTSWDGTYKGQDCETGEYYYHITARGNQGNVVNKSGSILLLR